MTTVKSRVRSIEKLVKTGRYAEAEREARSALKSGVQSPGVIKMLAFALRQRGQHRESAHWYDRLLLTDPFQIDLLTNQAINLAMLGDQEKALDLLQRAGDNCAGDYASNLKIADTYRRVGANPKAIKHYRMALRDKPDNAELHAKIGECYRRENVKFKAMEALEKAIELNPSNVRARVNLGRVLVSLENPTAAMEHFDAALAVSPRNGSANLGAARALKELRQTDKALERFRQVAKLHPNSAQPLCEISMLKRFGSGDPEMARIEELLAAAVEKDDRSIQVPLLLALAKAHQDCGNFEKSCDLYFDAKRIAAQESPYSLDVDLQYLERIKSVFDPETIRKGRAMGITGRSPVFVVGLPRCGKTSIAQLIGSHPRAYAEPEIVGLAWAVRELVPRDDEPFDADQARRALLTPPDETDSEAEGAKGLGAIPGRVKVSSNPVNFWALGAIEMMFPDAKIIHCKREPVSHSVAIFRSNFSSKTLAFCHDIEKTIDYIRIHDELMEYWKQTLETRIYEVRYDDLVRSGKQGVEELFAACGLDLSEVTEPLPDLFLGTHHDNGIRSYEIDLAGTSAESDRKLTDEEALIEAFCARVPALRALRDG